MAESKETIIIDIQLQGDAEARLGEVTQRMYDLKEENQKLKSEIKAGTTTWSEQAAAIKKNEQEINFLKAAEKDLSGIIATNTQVNKKYEDSNRGLAKELSDLQMQYDSLTSEMKDTSGGQAMLQHLKELDTQVKNNDASTGRFQKNVGNYENSFKSLRSELKDVTQNLAAMKLRGEENTEEYKRLQARGAELKDTLSDVSTELKNVGSDTKGIDQAVAGMRAVGAVTQLAQGTMALFGAENEDVQKSIQKMVAIQSVMNGVQEIGNMLQKESIFMLGVKAVKTKVLSVLTIVLTNLERIFGVTSATAMAMATAGISLIITGIVLLIANFKSVISSIEKFLGIAKDFKDVENSISAINLAIEGFGEDTDKIRERMEAEGVGQQEILNYTKKRLNDERKLHEDRYLKLSDLDRKLTDSEEEQLEASLNVIDSYQLKLYRLDTEQIKLDKRNKEDANKRGKDATQKAIDLDKKRKENAAKIYEELEDAKISAMQDGVKKTVKIESKNLERKIAELNSIKDLTVEGEENRIELIKKLNLNFNIWEKKTKENFESEKIQTELDREQKRLELKFDIVEKGGLQELSIRQLLLDNLKEQELNKAKETGADITAINIKYRKLENELYLELEVKKREKKKAIYDNEFDEVRLKLETQNALQVEFARLELEQAQQQATEISKVDAGLYKSKEQYDAAIIDSKRKVLEATKNVQLAEQQQYENQIAMAQGFGDAISTVLSEIAKDNKQALIFQKMIALANASLNLASAISAATMSAVKGDPYTMAIRIASSVASVIVSFSQVTKAIKAAQIPSIPKFANGGIVPGSSFSGDRVPILANSGEAILNQLQMKRLSSLIFEGKMPSGFGIDYELLGSIIASAPAPKLIMKEFNDFSKKMVTFNEFTKI